MCYVFVLQSSIDPLLAADALMGGIFISLVLRSIHPKLVRCVFKWVCDICLEQNSSYVLVNKGSGLYLIYGTYEHAFWCILCASISFPILVFRFFFLSCEKSWKSCRKLSRPNKINLREHKHPCESPFANASVSRTSTSASYTPVQGGLPSIYMFCISVITITSWHLTILSGQTSKSSITDSEAFYSTFHNTPNRRKFTKDEWELFTRETTRKAMEGLVASPDFSKWAISHADNLTLAPKRDVAPKQRKWFHWF